MLTGWSEDNLLHLNSWPQINPNICADVHLFGTSGNELYAEYGLDDLFDPK